MKSILDYFNGTPRDQQVQALLEFEDSIDASVVIISGPVAVGKSHIAHAISQYLSNKGISVGIATPTNILVDQYNRDFPEIPVIRRSNMYKNKNEFTSARQNAIKSPVSLSTYYGYVSNRLRKDCIILDEAHNVIDMIREQWGKNLWQHDYWFPDELESIGDVVQWMEESPHKKKLNKIRKEIICDRSYTVRLEDSFFRGKPDKCLKLIPLSVRDRKPWIWTYKTKKIVLMSATINEQDIYDLGLDRRKCKYIELDSPIPPSNRLIYYEPVLNMAYRLRDEAVSYLITKLLNDLNNERGKGIIHCTYDTAARLRFQLKHPRLMWHDKSNVRQKFHEFMVSPVHEGRVLVASGLGEGIDLAYDLARWQVITEVPYLNIKDPAIYYRARENPEWYEWQAVKTMIQTIGRICRTPTDRGKTKVYDRRFGRLLKLFRDLWPQYILDSVVDR